MRPRQSRRSRDARRGPRIRQAWPGDAMPTSVPRLGRRCASVVVWNHFSGDGGWMGEEVVDDTGLAKLCAGSFDAVWDRAIPHGDYRPS